MLNNYLGFCYSYILALEVPIDNIEWNFSQSPYYIFSCNILYKNKEFLFVFFFRQPNFAREGEIKIWAEIGNKKGYLYKEIFNGIFPEIDSDKEQIVFNKFYDWLYEKTMFNFSVNKNINYYYEDVPIFISDLTSQ